jgi:hypothetical protein
MRVKVLSVVALLVALAAGCSESSSANLDRGTGGLGSGGASARGGAAAGGATNGGNSGAGGDSRGTGGSSATGGHGSGGASASGGMAAGGAPNGGNSGAGGGSGGSGGNLGTKPLGSLEGYCGAVYDERARCGDLPENYRSRSEDIADCVHDFGRPDVYRGDVFGAIQACLATLECSRSVDECNMDGALVVSSDPEKHPLITTCMAKVADCKNSATPFHDDSCLMGLFLLESLKPDFNICMGKPCDAVGACLSALFGT